MKFIKNRTDCMMNAFNNLLKENANLTESSSLTYQQAIDLGESIAEEMNLPMDKYAVETRKEYCKNVFYTYLREVKNGKLDLTYINSALSGNLASFYSHAAKLPTNAPR